MNTPRNYRNQVTNANIDATSLAAMGVPATAILEVMQTECDQGQAFQLNDPSIIMQGYEFACNQSYLDWKAMTLATGAFMATSVHRGITARRNAEYQNFMLETGMELGRDSFARRSGARLIKGAAMVGAYAVGTKLNLEADLGGAFAMTAAAVGYAFMQSRKMGWKLLGR